MIAAFRDQLGRLLGRRPPEMQVAALCRNPATGDVLLITSRGTGRWVLPKGWPMPGRSLADAALQEAWEEAGVRGRVRQDEIGRYHYDKVQDRGFAIPVEVRIFAVDVDSLGQDFREAAERSRRWFPPDEAAKLVAESGLQQLLRSLPAGQGQA
ncbi:MULTISPECIES: NUDIX hydrolase [unclassified Paracoccus (in: a-proteobacteria)]|uniref:NUDIX hydrolase n=1 Tax=unclassified Paracoccus (in: a-proteobacteria) TaxID=2688777 RepID=UPI0012B1F454|nr:MULTISPECIES: NUDIX hydrolase [unclassified Paracoccus (in: a-proteobacteria)]UXU75431.1 NUDIX hydrolase [Paracoccus sp. SMMA_5]UXU81337.1 NUDIX hydrolase [Paracoccus sp. SMMA_5_TC]